MIWKYQISVNTCKSRFRSSNHDCNLRWTLSTSITIYMATDNMSTALRVKFWFWLKLRPSRYPRALILGPDSPIRLRIMQRQHVQHFCKLFATLYLHFQCLIRRVTQLFFYSSCLRKWSCQQLEPGLGTPSYPSSEIVIATQTWYICAADRFWTTSTYKLSKLGTCNNRAEDFKAVISACLNNKYRINKVLVLQIQSRNNCTSAHWLKLCRWQSLDVLDGLYLHVLNDR